MDPGADAGHASPRPAPAPRSPSVNVIGTLDTSACICIQSSLAAGPPDTTVAWDRSSCSRSVRRMSSVP